MNRKAVILVSLVPESRRVDNGRIEKAICRTLRCDWLAEVEKVTVKNGEQNAGISSLRDKQI